MVKALDSWPEGTWVRILGSCLSFPARCECLHFGQPAAAHLPRTPGDWNQGAPCRGARSAGGRSRESRIRGAGRNADRRTAALRSGYGRGRGARTQGAGSAEGRSREGRSRGSDRNRAGRAAEGRYGKGRVLGAWHPGVGSAEGGRGTWTGKCGRPDSSGHHAGHVEANHPHVEEQWDLPESRPAERGWPRTGGPAGGCPEWEKRNAVGPPGERVSGGRRAADRPPCRRMPGRRGTRVLPA